MKFIKLSFIIIVCIGVVYAVLMCQDLDLFKSKSDIRDNSPMPSHMTDIIGDEDPIAKQLEEYQRMLEKEDVTFEQINEMRIWAVQYAGNMAIEESGIRETLTAYCDIIRTITTNSPKLTAGELKSAFNKHKDLIKPVHAEIIRQVFEIDGKSVDKKQEEAINARLKEDRKNGTQYKAFRDLPSAKDAVEKTKNVVEKPIPRNSKEKKTKCETGVERIWDDEMTGIER